MRALAALGRVGWIAEVRPATGARSRRFLCGGGSTRDKVAGSNVDALAADRRKRQLIRACHEGDVQQVRAFVEAGGDVGDVRLSVYPLHVAAMTGNDDLTDYLLEQGADPDHAAGVKVLGPAALHLAAEKGHAGVVDRLARAGADVDLAAMQFSATPLHFAALNGHVDAVQALIRAGANVKAPTAEGATAESIAKDAGHTAVQELLLARS